MDFLLNIGNTHTEIAEWGEDTFRFFRRIPTASLSAADLPCDGNFFAASVVPEIRERFRERNCRYLCAADAAGQIDFSAVDVSTLGADRIANAVAAAALFPLPAAVLDCGTALTLELVDQHRRFLGGAIAPGRLLLRRALSLFTAQLPETALSDSYEATPGTDTAENIGFGTDGAAVGAVREFIGAVRRRTGERTTFIVTGGDAPFFLRVFPELIPAPEHFTLSGIRLLAENIGRDRIFP